MIKNLGEKGKDKITGFEGIITAYCYYQYCSPQYCLTPAVDKDGNKRAVEWFETERIEIFDNNERNSNDK